MDIKPIKTSTIQDKVYDELLSVIISGRIMPGEKLNIENLANLFGVSLTPVRLALQKLEAGGFVTISSYRHVSVRELASRDLLEIQQIRLMLECRAAEEACRIRNDECLATLEELDQKCIKAVDEDAYLQANREFHRLIYQQAHMPIFLEVIDSLWLRLSPYLHILLRSEQDWSSEKFHAHHRGMIGAFRNQDSAAMRDWLTQDITEAARLIASRLDHARGVHSAK